MDTSILQPPRDLKSTLNTSILGTNSQHQEDLPRTRSEPMYVNLLLFLTSPNQPTSITMEQSKLKRRLKLLEPKDLATNKKEIIGIFYEFYFEVSEQHEQSTLIITH